jgi:large subunit ribosomal protein L17
MPRPKKGPRFGGSPAHSNKIVANLATELFLHEKVTTTLPRAQAVRPLAEKLITKARKGDLHSKRVVMRTIPNRDAVVRLFDDVAPRYADRQGGYTRIVKLGPRRGDGAEEAVIELV